MRLLPLFDGTGSVCKPFREAGWEIQSVDCDGRFGATIVTDKLQWDYSNEPTPNVIFSEFHVSNIHKRARLEGRGIMLWLIAWRKNNGKSLNTF